MPDEIAMSSVRPCRACNAPVRTLLMQNGLGRVVNAEVGNPSGDVLITVNGRGIERESLILPPVTFESLFTHECPDDL